MVKEGEELGMITLGMEIDHLQIFNITRNMVFFVGS